MLLTLPARPPFNLHSVLYSHGWIQLAPLETHADEQGFTFPLRLSSGRVTLLEVRPAEEGVSLSSPEDFSPGEAAEVAQTIDWMLGLDQDFSPFYIVAQDEPHLQRAAELARGRILRSPTVFEDVIKTLLTTNTLWAATKRMVRNVVEQFGDPYPGDTSRIAFPTPESIAHFDEATLRSQTRLGYRAPFVLALAQRAASGELDLEIIKTQAMTTPELRKYLLGIKGIGDYAAANLLMLFGHYDYIPVDSWASKMVSLEWYNGEPVSRKQVEAAFDRFGPWKGLAYWLWQWSHSGG